MTPGLTVEDWARIERAAAVIRDGTRTNGAQVANELLPDGEYVGVENVRPHQFESREGSA